MDNSPILEKMYEIQNLGNFNPELALSQLDSLSEDVSEQSEYVRMKYALLRIRLNDKADNIPESAKPVREVLNYFMEHGNKREKQEANYYTGSVYRDLQDAPTAISYFLQAEYWAEKAGEECDSIMWGNTCSNLAYLYFYVTDYKSLLKYAKKEYDLAIICNDLCPTTMIHLADSYYYNDSIEEAYNYYDLELEIQKESDIKSLPILENLLSCYSNRNKQDKADICATLLNKELAAGTCIKNSNTSLVLAFYYRLKGDTVLAIDNFKEVLQDSIHLINYMEACKNVLRYYIQQADYKKASQYADMFVAAYDTMQLGKLQEQANTVNNLYRYYRDQEEERKILDESREARERFWWIVVVFVIIVLAVVIAHLYYRNKQLQRVSALSRNLKELSKEKEKIEGQLWSRDAELASAKLQLDEVMLDLKKTEESKQLANAELARISEELRENERLLEEKSRMNKNVLSLLHQVQFEQNAESYLQDLKDSANGMRDMTPSEWNRLYRCIDNLWPDFNAKMCAYYHKVSESRKRILYLHLAGFNIKQILNLTGMSRATVWRALSEESQRENVTSADFIPANNENP